MSISTTIKSIQDIMRKDVGVDGDAQRIGQLVWMLFLKIYDDRETEWELLDDSYRSPVPKALRWRHWAANTEGITGDELLDFVNTQLFPTLKNLTPPADDQRGFVIRSVFEDAYNYMKSGQLMRQVINKISEGIDFNKAQDRHLFGDLYEQILRDLQNAGNAGEYYTPRPVTQFMVEMVDPKLGEPMLDPACGTGGFITCTIEHVRQHYVKTVEDERQLQASIHGVEKKPLPHLLCTTNMLLHGIDVPTQIRHDNTLSRPLRDYGPRDRFAVVVTNPPFGGMEEDGIEQNFPATFRTRETADLFLVLIAHLLKDNGRAAVVLPDGTLFGEGIKTRIKQHLLETCNLHTIVRLPNGVFNPYTGIKTNLLFFTKGTPTKEIWYYEHPYPAGYKSYSKTKPMRIEEFAAEREWWGKRDKTKENKFAWCVSIDEIKARNYNLDIKNPHSPDSETHAPEELLADYRRLLTKIDILCNKLKGILTNVLINQLSTPLLIEEFHQLAVVPNGVQKLRELILNLAVRGTLVPQDAEDEPAAELLKRIRKAQGLNELKKLPPVAPDEQAHSLPASWQWVRFGDIAQHNSGKTLDSGRNSGQARDYLTTSNLYWGRFELGNVRQMLIRDEELERCTARKNDLLICEGGEAGRAAVWEQDKEVCFQNHIHRARFFCEVDPYFAYRFFEKINATGEINQFRKGVAISNMSGKTLASIPFPLPPLAEQTRIVTKVDTLLTLCDHLATRLNASQELSTKLVASATKAALACAFPS